MTGIFSKPAGRRRFGSDERGAIAPMAAVTLATLVLGSGVALDISRLISARHTLQDAVDSANLALARMPASTSPAVLKSTAEAWIKANVDDGQVTNLQIGTPERTLGQIKLRATADVNALLTAVKLPVEGNSVVKYGTSHIELALVLDNTGSMGDSGKLEALKTAAKTLVDKLSESAKLSGDPDALKIGVVPFSISVNVGSANSTAAWITGVQPTAYGKDIFTTASTNRFTLFTRMQRPWGGCVESRPMPYDIQDTAPTAGTGGTMFVPFFAPDEPDEFMDYDGDRYGYGNDYMNDHPDDRLTARVWNQTYGGSYKGWELKQGNPAKYDGVPDRSGQIATSPYPVGPNSGCGTAAVLPLTTNIAAVNAKLTQMVAYGNTHVPMGLVWGWHVVSPNAPYALGSPYNAKGVVKIVVLVTDGANTYTTNANNHICKSGGRPAYCTPDTNDSHYTGYGYKWQNRISTNGGNFSNPALAMNDRLGKLCANMKAAKIEMYTVPVQVDDLQIKALLQSCASSADKYIDVANAGGLQDAFENIAGSISGLRVAQ